MALEIPKIGLVMETVRVTRWLKGVGEDVKMGEPLLEVESEKSVIEIEAAVGGRLEQILVSVDQEAKVGDRIAWVETGEAPSLPASRPEPPSRETTGARATAPNRLLHADARIRSSPLARRTAAEHGLDLRQVAGSGPGGRVQLGDVQQALGGAAAERSACATAPASAGLSPMRRALVRAMTLSNATVPQFTVERALDCTLLNALRIDYSAAALAASPRLSMNDFLLQAIARSLIELPAMNATFSGDVESADACVIPARGAHIGLVVAVEGGLLVPVIHDVEHLGLMELALRRHECVERALKGRLKREELEGATFSISNLGSGGPDRFAAMINPPQSGILGVGRQRDGVVVRDGEIAVRTLSELTLTVDHRVADGRLAALFLSRLVEILEARDWRR